MKYLLTSLAIAIGCVSVQAEVGCMYIGNSKVCNNGYSERTFGNFTSGNDGSSRYQSGNTVIYHAPEENDAPSNSMHDRLDSFHDSLNINSFDSSDEE